MSCAAIMVHIDPEGDLTPRVKLVQGLAERLGCDVIGVSSWMPQPVFIADNVMIDAPPDEQVTRALEDALREKERTFRNATANWGRPVHWRSALEFPTALLAREAVSADLLVIGRDASPFNAHRDTDAGALALGAGRPVLVVPPGVASLALDHALVAWKSTREARRALTDALPLLKKARAVTVLAIAESGDESGGLDQAAGFLERHGIAVTAEPIRASDGNAGTILLREAAARSCDLVVAGAYGRSRVGEWLFGGVTRHLLTQSPVCCLLSH